MENKKFEDIGVPVKLGKPDDFNILIETLSRIGIASKKTKTLYQSCHLLHKRGEYRIVHFLEMFALDGKPTSLTEDDIKRRNTIAKLIDQWKLATVLDKTLIETAPVTDIKIVPFKEKKEWTLISKYTLGTKKRTH
jgi:hypothetical protein